MHSLRFRANDLKRVIAISPRCLCLIGRLPGSTHPCQHAAEIRQTTRKTRVYRLTTLGIAG